MARRTFFDTIRDQLSTIPPVVTVDLTGKTVVVTGSNTGLGFEAAKHFARMNPAKLILACRDKQRGEAALAKLKIETGYNGAEVWVVDQADFSSVKAFADKFLKEEDRLDHLMLNAGIGTMDYNSTKDGWEASLQVNHLSTALLALLLLPRMIETARRHSVTPRLVVISSDMHYYTKFDQEVRNSEQPLKVLGSREYCTPPNMRRRYSDTKLLNVFFVRALADRLSNLPIIVNTVNPSYAQSELRRNVKDWAANIFFFLMDLLLAIPTEKASRRLIWGAIGGKEDEESLRGAFISRPGVTEPSDFVIGEQGGKMQETLWKETVNILSKVDSRVTETATQVLPRD